LIVLFVLVFDGENFLPEYKDAYDTADFANSLNRKYNDAFK
jgi:hypothetical protein